MRPWILALPMMWSFAHIVPAQSWFKENRSFSLYEENDAFGGKSDDDYTQGLRLSWDFSVWDEAWTRAFRVTAFGYLDNLVTGRAIRVRNACDPQTPRSARPCGTVGFSIGQTMYTPTDLVTTAVQPRERPYAGYLFFALSRNVLFKRAQVSSEINVGVTGPQSLARETQSLAHWTWSSGSPQPQGWDNQLRTMLHVSIINQYVLPRLYEFCMQECNGLYTEGRRFDITPRAEAVVGTLMTRASFGGTIRAGFQFPDVTGLQRIPVTRSFATSDDHPAPWFMVFGTLDGRLVGHNALLSGSIPDRDAGGWHSIKEIETNHVFGELAGGYAFGFRYGTFVHQFVRRGDEYRPTGKAQWFGSLTFSIHAPARAG